MSTTMSTTLKDRLGIEADAEAGVDRVRTLSPLEQEWKKKTYDRLLEIADLTMLAALDKNKGRAQIREITQRLFTEMGAPLALPQRQLLARRIEDEVLGLGPLEPLLSDPTVSDILVNGAKSVYVERRGKIEPTTITFHDDAHLMNIIDRIGGRYIEGHRTGKTQRRHIGRHRRRQNHHAECPVGFHTRDGTHRHH